MRLNYVFLKVIKSQSFSYQFDRIDLVKNTSCSIIQTWIEFFIITSFYCFFFGSRLRINGIGIKYKQILFILMVNLFNFYGNLSNFAFL